MKIFLDTSSLFKLYHQETGSDQIVEFLATQKSYAIYIAEITKIEFLSALYKKLRLKEIEKFHLEVLTASFKNDLKLFHIIQLNEVIIDSSCKLFSDYGNKGLRSLDALQLAAAISVKHIIDIAITSDALLNSFLVAENVKILTGLPTSYNPLK